MQTEKIIDICCKNLSRFCEILKDENYQLRGIFNSEALLIVSLAKELEVKRILESGRARGHSTNLIAKFFQNDGNIKIISIDFDKNSKDAKYSTQYLKKYENVQLLHGDSNKILLEQAVEPCIVFIDGPKGDEALILTAKLLKNKNVKCVMVHDLHKNTFHRNISEIIFTEKFFSDEHQFVGKFKHLDEQCWAELEDTGHAPYIRNGKDSESYASTLGIFFNSNSPLNERVYSNYFSYYCYSKMSFKKIIRSFIIKSPFLYTVVAQVKKVNK